MTSIEQAIAKDAALPTPQLGAVWVQPTPLAGVQIRIAGTDNALLIELNGETWTIPEAYRLASFR